MDRQHQTTKLQHVARQDDLFTSAAPERVEVSDQVVANQPSMLAALMLSVQASGLAPKQIYEPLGMDKARWSKIQSGQGFFPIDKLVELQTLLANDIPLRWLAMQAQCTLVPLLSKTEAELAKREAEIEELKKENKIIKSLLRPGTA